MGGSNVMIAISAIKDQPRIGMKRLDDSNIPHSRARLIQNKGMNEASGDFYSNLLIR
jgi:hypothetical protein